MEFHYTNPQTELESLLGGHYSINAIGVIKPGDAGRFADFLQTTCPPPQTTVHIDSLGGCPETAMGIGRLIRINALFSNIGTCTLDTEQMNSVIVPRKYIDGACMSAATLAFVGGQLRFVKEGSQFGVHQFAFKTGSTDSVAQAQELAAKIAAYLEEMGISQGFLLRSWNTPAGEISLLNKDELAALGVFTGAATKPSWTIQSHGQAMYVRGEWYTNFGHQKIILGHMGNGFYFHAVRESQGREYELTGFPLVEVTVNSATELLNISAKCARTVNGAYTNIIAALTKEEAEKIANSESVGLTIRLTQEAPTFLGIYPMSTEGGSDKLKTLFQSFA